jgi:hypothetical protein
VVVAAPSAITSNSALLNLRQLLITQHVELEGVALIAITLGLFMKLQPKPLITTEIWKKSLAT